MPSTVTVIRSIRMRHSVQLRHRVGTLAIDVAFEIDKPWTILFGPSGSGKSTILRAIAGLLRPDEASITSHVAINETDQRTFTLVDTRHNLWTPPEKRDIRLAPQQSSLFPHKTVRENLAYGVPRPMRDEDQPAYHAGITRLLDAFHLSALADRYPRELSGGEEQRVNLARACASGGRLLMLDEPLTGLDVDLRDDILARIRQRQRHTPILSVTHDIAEAFQLNAEVIRLHMGKVVAQGPVEEVLAEERVRLLRLLGAEAMPLRSSEPFLGG